ncbi:MAG: serine aminopeptidase domain-containing protein [Bacteroidota bacterium]
MRNILLISLLFCGTIVKAQDLSAFQSKLFIQGTDTLRYRILYPDNYKKNRAYPLVMFLHGAGERGNDNAAQLTHGASLFLKPENRKYFKSIVIFPQCPANKSWSKFKRVDGKMTIDSESAPPVEQQLVKALMDSMLLNRHILERQIYLGGLSMGAFGSYDMLIRYPEYFAAAFAICGIADIPKLVQKAKEVPMWIFHGEKDPVVSPEPNRELYKALMTAGATDVTYSEYPGVGHDSWTNAFAEPKLLPWVFSHKKKLKKK